MPISIPKDKKIRFKKDMVLITTDDFDGITAENQTLGRWRLVPKDPGPGELTFGMKIKVCRKYHSFFLNVSSGSLAAPTLTAKITPNLEFELKFDEKKLLVPAVPGKFLRLTMFFIYDNPNFKGELPVVIHFDTESWTGRFMSASAQYDPFPDLQFPTDSIEYNRARFEAVFNPLEFNTQPCL